MLMSLTDINNVLKAMSAKKAANVVKSLISCAIFPVITQAQGGKRKLMKPSNKTWFIADRKYLRDSFLGKLPILDFTVQEIEDLLDLLKALDLDSRKLSLLVDCQCLPKGQLKYSVPASWYFRTRAPFVKAEREAWSKLVETAYVSYAAGVERRYTFKRDLETVEGRPDETMISCSVANDSMQIFLADGFSTESQSAVADVVEMISQEFDFKEPLVIRLLHTLFGEKDHETILRAFERHGFRVDEFPRFGIRFTPRRGVPTREPKKADRRLPILQLTGYDEEDEDDVEEEFFQPDNNLEYLGQRVIRLQEQRYDQEDGRHNLVVLIRVYNVFKSPCLQFLLNPWEAIWSRNSQALQGSVLKMVMPFGGDADVLSVTAGLQSHDSQVKDDQVPILTITAESDDTRGPELPRSLHRSEDFHYYQQYCPPTAQHPGFMPVTYAPYFLGWSPSLIQSPFNWPMNPQTMWNNLVPSSNNFYGETYDAPLGEISSNPVALSRTVPTKDWEKLPKYVYRKLQEKKEIRVFVLFPGKEDEFLRGMIQACSFDDPIPYNAVSYVWGEKK
ncbi:hypothetical protein IL306_004327 [Fusarium sp. DS 682]|nr:hypothetical protein IL306_004327 [Fusarium sp. DS 682]